MQQTILDHIQDLDIRLPHVNALTRLRRSFFALSATAAMRYQVSFEAVVHHLWQARSLHGRIPIRGVIFIQDLVHAVGCLSGNSPAWADLSELHERLLIRQCMSRIEESDAIVYVRRFLRDMQCGNQDTKSDPSSLNGFIGDQPLRTWMSDQISDALTGGVTIHRAHHGTIQWRSNRLGEGRHDHARAALDCDPFQFPRPRHELSDLDSAPHPAVTTSD